MESRIAAMLCGRSNVPANWKDRFSGNEANGCAMIPKLSPFGR
jgi:hypothetical protein